MKVWCPLTDEVIDDTKRGEDDSADPTAIGGGRIVIHKDNEEVTTVRLVRSVRLSSVSRRTALARREARLGP